MKGEGCDDIHRSILEGEFVCVLAEHERPEFVTSAFEKKTGYEADQLADQSFFEFVHPEDRPGLRETFEDVLEQDSGAKQRQLYRFRDADGTWHRHDAVLRIRRGDRTPQGVVFKIRELDTLHGQDIEPSASIDRITDGFMTLDTEWRFTYVNDEAARLLQHSKDELLGKGLWKVLPEARDSTFHERARETMATQEPVTSEEYSRTLDSWYKLRMYPSERGLAVHFTDITDRKEREEALTALHCSTRELLQNETRHGILQGVVRAATDVLDLSAVAVYEFDEADAQLKPAECSEHFREQCEAPPEFGPDKQSISWHAFMEDEVLMFDDVRDSTYLFDGVTEVRSGLYAPIGNHGLLVAIDTEPGRFDETTELLADLLATSACAALDRVEQDEELRNRDREIEQRNERLSRVNRLNETIRQIDRTLVRADAREEIERAVCEHLTEMQEIAFAWVGEPSGSDTFPEPRASAGESSDYLDAISLGHPQRAAEPSFQASEEGRSVLVSNIATDVHDDPWREEALFHGYHAVLSIPLVYHDITYGVVSVYADESGAFDTELRSVFEELADTVAYAIHALEHRAVDGQPRELRVEMDDTQSLFQLIADRCDGRLSLEGLTTNASDSAAFFIDVAADTERVSEVLTEFTSVRGFDHIRETDRGTLFRIHAERSMYVTVLADHSATLRSLTTDGSRVTATIAVPRSEDETHVIEMLSEMASDVRVLRKRDTPSIDRVGPDPTHALPDSVTDRQREVVQTAYHAGFFQSPRAVSGQEVADVLDISPQAFHRHLRIVQRKVFTNVFDLKSDGPDISTGQAGGGV